MRRALSLLAVTIPLAACGNEAAKPEPAPVPEEQTVLIRVVIRDQLPLDLYLNLDGQQCHAKSENLLETGAPPTITIRDAAGTILDTKDAPSVGGVFDKTSGCSVAVTFSEVVASSVYTVTATRPDGFEVKRDVARSDAASMTVELLA